MVSGISGSYIKHFCAGETLAPNEHILSVPKLVRSQIALSINTRKQESSGLKCIIDSHNGQSKNKLRRTKLGYYLQIVHAINSLQLLFC